MSQILIGKPYRVERNQATMQMAETSDSESRATSTVTQPEPPVQEQAGTQARESPAAQVQTPLLGSGCISNAVIDLTISREDSPVFDTTWEASDTHQHRAHSISPELASPIYHSIMNSESR